MKWHERRVEIVLVTRCETFVPSCEGSQGLETDSDKSRVPLVSNGFRQLTEMGLIKDRTVLGDRGQYCVRIVCDKLLMTGTITITGGVASLQVSQ